MNYIDDDDDDDDEDDDDEDDAIDSHLNFLVPNIIMENEIVLLILKVFVKIVSIIEIIIKTTTRENKL